MDKYACDEPAKSPTSGHAVSTPDESSRNGTKQSKRLNGSKRPVEVDKTSGVQVATRPPKRLNTEGGSSVLERALPELADEVSAFTLQPNGDTAVSINKQTVRLFRLPSNT